MGGMEGWECDRGSDDGRVMDGCIEVSQKGLQPERIIQSLNLERV